MVEHIERLPRTGDAHVFVASMKDGSRERIMVWPANDVTEERTLETARAEIERRVVTRGR